MSNLIPEASPLRRLPQQLDARQRVILDGIRYAVEMAEVSFARLCDALLAIAQDSARERLPIDFASPFLDAWSIIDSVNRLRPLTLLIQGARDHPTVRAFLAATDVIRALRDDVQHLNARVDRLVRRQLPTWGTISWVTLHDGTPVLLRSHVIVAGTVSTGNYPMENPAGQRLRRPIDLIKLTAHERTVNLREALGGVAGLVTMLEDQMSGQFENFPHTGADIYLTVDMAPTVDHAP